MAEVVLTPFLMENLACPICKANPLVVEEGCLICPVCARRFANKDGIWYMAPDYLHGDTLFLKEDVDKKYVKNLAEVIDRSDKHIGERYDMKAMMPGTLRELIERVTAFELLGLKGGEYVLDVGAGTLRNGIYALQKGAEVVCAIDLIPGMLEWGKAKADERGFDGKVSAIVADARFIPFRDGAFHSIISLELVEHIPIGADMVFREIFRVLKPGGTAVVNVWSIATHTTNRHQKNMGYFYNNAFYKFYFRREFLDLFSDIDFTRKELYGHYLVPFIGYLLCKMKIPRSVGFSLAIERIVRRCCPRLSILLGRFLVVKLEK